MLIIHRTCFEKHKNRFLHQAGQLAIAKTIQTNATTIEYLYNRKVCENDSAYQLHCLEKSSGNNK